MVRPMPVNTMAKKRSRVKLSVLLYLVIDLLLLYRYVWNPRQKRCMRKLFGNRWKKNPFLCPAVLSPVWCRWLTFLLYLCLRHVPLWSISWTCLVDLSSFVDFFSGNPVMTHFMNIPRQLVFFLRWLFLWRVSLWRMPRRLVLFCPVFSKVWCTSFDQTSIFTLT